MEEEEKIGNEIKGRDKNKNRNCRNGVFEVSLLSVGNFSLLFFFSLPLEIPSK